MCYSDFDLGFKGFTYSKNEYPQVMRLCIHLPSLQGMPIQIGALIQLLLESTTKE